MRNLFKCVVAKYTRSREKLQKYRNALKRAAKISTKIAHKKKIFINQTGGFPPIVLSAISPVLAGLLGQVLAN